MESCQVRSSKNMYFIKIANKYCANVQPDLNKKTLCDSSWHLSRITYFIGGL